MNNLDVIQTMSEYYGKEMSDGQIKMYLGTLDDIPGDLLDMASKHLIKTGKPWMPKVSELRTAALQLKREWELQRGDPLKLIPGAAQTEADLDERYGTREEWKEIGELLEADDYVSLTAEQEALLKGDRLDH